MEASWKAQAKDRGAVRKPQCNRDRHHRRDFSPLGGRPDAPENYRTLAQHSADHGNRMLEALKSVVESTP
jgi:hypothetical protein